LIEFHGLKNLQIENKKTRTGFCFKLASTKKRVKQIEIETDKEKTDKEETDKEKADKEETYK
jgi:hypothetical protein